MAYSGMLRRVVLLKTDSSEESYHLHHQGDKNRRARGHINSN
jgi:hypothetical protein